MTQDRDFHLDGTLKGRLLIFDTETTDKIPGQICQLSYLKIHENGEIEPKNFFFKVDEMSKGAQNVHGFTMKRLDELSNGKRFADHADEILNDFDWATNAIAHNISFDSKFIFEEMLRVNKAMFLHLKRPFCTMKHFTDIVKLPFPKGSFMDRYFNKEGAQKFKWPKLEEVSGNLNIPSSEITRLTNKIFSINSASSHDARRDVVETYICLLMSFERKHLNAQDFITKGDHSKHVREIQKLIPKSKLIADLYEFSKLEFISLNDNKKILKSDRETNYETVFHSRIRKYDAISDSRKKTSYKNSELESEKIEKSPKPKQKTMAMNL